ncbi:Aspartokinase [Candidatus Vidania fulgoroideae]|uniref:aspartate kinase n=1 Tax=Candidatus Vidania fulgoroideorum TaxID=881286 RepID=A0A346E0D8_9PROT|nr:Aspartokinase [Candidatus Vidania fulgoroideae]WDI79388.1 hypothetical protein ONB79_00830 [Candidatus Vidania fulgoroideae]WDR79293.1 hypothetical protein ONB65_00195 [Candidatus Vidania fulgoroideae]
MFKIIVKKFGGEALKNIENINKIANIIKKNSLEKKIIVVVSAPKNFTDLLYKISKQNIYKKEEKNVLLSCGEQISSSILSGVLNKMKVKSTSLQGWQVPIFVNKNMEIEYIYKRKIKNLFKKNNVIVISGFQGVDKKGNIKILNRGDSDTSAVFLANIFKSKCFFYKDTDGIYQTDPKLIKTKKIKNIYIKDLIEISSLGSKILSLNSVKKIIKNKLTVNVLSFKNMKKTKIIYKKKNNNFLIIKEENLFRINYLKTKIINNIDMIKLTKKNIYFTTNLNLNLKRKKIYKVSVLGYNIKIKVIKILLNIKKYIYKNIINSLENKFSFLIKKNNKKIVLKKITKIFKK